MSLIIMYKEKILKRGKGCLLALHIYKLDKKNEEIPFSFTNDFLPIHTCFKGALFIYMMLLFYVFYTCLCYRVYMYEILLQIIRPGLNILIQFIQTLLHAVCEAGSERCRSRKIHL